MRGGALLHRKGGVRLMKPARIYQELTEGHRLQVRRIGLKYIGHGLMPLVIFGFVRLHDQRRRHRLPRLVQRHADLHASRGRIVRDRHYPVSLDWMRDDQGHLGWVAFAFNLDGQVGDQEADEFGRRKHTFTIKHICSIINQAFEIVFKVKLSRIPEKTMSHEFMTIETATQRSGLHPNALRRLLRAGVIYGYKASHEGKQHWLISPRSLKNYADPVKGFLLDLPGPKVFLKRTQR